MSESYSVPQDVKEVLQESHTQILARLKLANVSNEDAAKQLGVTVHRVRKLMEMEEFKSVLRDETDKLTKEAVTTWKGQVSKLIGKSLSVLEKNLDKGNLEAVKLVLRSIGADEVKEESGNTAINVILPNFKQERVIEVDHVQEKSTK